MKCTHEKFIESVNAHRIYIFSDDGPCRHIRFANPKSSNCHFELTTWPDHFCISGDMGTYVFRRLTDMFEFFRQADPKRINPGYWHEKMVSDSQFEPAKKYSEELFKTAVKNDFRWACLSNEIDLSKRRSVWQRVKDEILRAENEYEAYSMTSFFDCKHAPGLFMDFYEHRLTEFSYHFIWCLRAIVWGISQYDKAKG